MCAFKLERYSATSTEEFSEMHKEGFFFRTGRNLRADAWRLKETVNPDPTFLRNENGSRSGLLRKPRNPV